MNLQNMILLLFALFFSLGLYLILAAVFKVPTYKATKAVLGAVKKNKKQAKNSDAIITELAAKLAKILPMDDYKRRRLTATSSRTVSATNWSWGLWVTKPMRPVSRRRCLDSSIPSSRAEP